ncbi:hypothetical protein BJY04DRAFT_213593 [Aspergillus karnatakaensis]|uniref:uncharacterized protein n=1 Tax=Aspergillus karnatakaensis TaxID=1810916 RepID=UPI003CCE4422
MFGFMVGQSFHLFQLIPEVAALAHWPQLVPEIPRHEDPNLLTDFTRLETQIMTWDPAASLGENHPSSSEEVTAASHTAGLIHHHALLIFLRASLCGPGIPPSHFLAQIDELLCEFMSFLNVLTASNRVWTNLLWAVLIAGSCVRNLDDRECIHNTLVAQTHRMNTSTRVLQVLHWVWDAVDVDPVAYGPHGISTVCKKNGVKISLG